MFVFSQHTFYNLIGGNAIEYIWQCKLKKQILFVGKNAMGDLVFIDVRCGICYYLIRIFIFERSKKWHIQNRRF